jgi:hypothetical protein
MKKLYLIMLILLALGALIAIEVNLLDGKVLRGDSVRMEKSFVILQAGEDVYQIPANQIKSVMDGDKDITKEVLGDEFEKTALDNQFMPRDVYFISDSAWEKDQETLVIPAKMMNPISPKQGEEADFVTLADSKPMSAKYWYKTKIASGKDIIPEEPVLFFGMKSESGFYMSPLDKEEAIKGKWFVAMVKGIKTWEKGYITLSDGNQVYIDNLRVIVKQ